MLTATACSNDETVEVPQGAAIGFKTMIDKNAGRAAEELTTAKLTDFFVYGWAGDVAVFDHVKVSGSSSNWTYSPIKYWEEANYKFVAIASDKNASCATTFNATAAGEGTVSFELNGGNEDFVYDTYTRDNSAAIDDAVVPFVFKHALSRVRFTFVNAIESSNYTIAISDLKINDAAASGTFTIPATTWTSGTDTEEVTFTIDGADLANADNVETADVKENTAVSKYQYIIPGSTEQEISFTITLKGGAEDKVYNHTVKIAPTDAFAAGNSYNFTATINSSNVNPDKELKPILFDATVEDWTDDTDATVTVK